MSEAPAPPPAFIWCDLETTDLDERSHHPLEVSIIVTGDDLTVLAEKTWLVHRDPLLPLDDPDGVIAKMHGPDGTGLLALCARATATAAEVDADAVAWLASVGCAPRACTMAGRSLHFDRRWLRLHFPRLHDHLASRNHDVTVLRREMYRAGLGCSEYAPKHHRGLADLREDIAVVRMFRDVLRQASSHRQFLAGFFHTDGV